MYQKIMNDLLSEDNLKKLEEDIMLYGSSCIKYSSVDGELLAEAIDISRVQGSEIHEVQDEQ